MQRGFKIGLPEVKFGVPAPLFFPGAAVNCVGQRAAELAVLSGKLYSAVEAADMGLVDAVGDSRSSLFTSERTYASYLDRYFPPQRGHAEQVPRRAPSADPGYAS